MQFVFILLLFLTVNSFAQQSKIDSLLTLLNTNKEDTNKVIHLNALGLELEYNNPDTAIILGRQALSIAEKLQWKKGIVNSLGNLGVYNYLKDDYPQSLGYYLKALKMHEDMLIEAKNSSEKKSAQNGIASCLGNIANVYLSQADYPKALDYYFKALKMAEELGNKSRMAIQLGNIGILYYNQGDYSKTLDYYFKALKIGEEIGDKNKIAAILGNIGNVYKRQGDFPKVSPTERNQSFDLALDYYLMYLNLSEELGNKNYQASALGSIGSLYTKTGKFKQAEQYLKRAIAIDDSIGALYDLKQHEESLSQLYDTTARLAVDNGQLAKAAENYKLSMLYYKKAVTLKDSIFSEETSKQITRKEMNFEFEKKEEATKAAYEKRMMAEEADKNMQRIIIWSVAGGLLLVVLFAGFIFRSLRITRRQKVIIEEKNRNVTDSINYAKRIQESFLLSEEKINKLLPYQSFVFFQPKDIVSGDFYWVSSVNNNDSTLYVAAAADCTGHGVPGAFLSMMGNMLLHEIVIEKRITDPALILREIHYGIFHILHRDNELNYSLDGMDIALCVIDPAKQVISYAGAMNPLYIVRQQTEEEKDAAPFLLEVIKADIMSLGGRIERSNMPAEMSFTSHLIPIQKGMCLYLFSDGYMDQFNREKKLRFGSARFKKLMVDSAPLTMKQQKEKLLKEFSSWKGRDKQIDDVLVMGIKF